MLGENAQKKLAKLLFNMILNRLHPDWRGPYRIAIALISGIKQGVIILGRFVTNVNQSNRPVIALFFGSRQWTIHGSNDCHSVTKNATVFPYLVLHVSMCNDRRNKNRDADRRRKGVLPLIVLGEDPTPR